MPVSLEWMNLTLSREALDVVCEQEVSPNGITMHSGCGVEYAPAIFFPSFGIRAEL
jgi:hypothetical protein